MIEDRNIVCFASSWYIDPTSKHQIMKRLSRGNSVIWVNYHASRRPQLNKSDLRGIWEKLRRARQGADHVSDGLRVLTPVLIPLPETPPARRLNRWLLRRRIRRELALCEPRPVQFWTFAPDVASLAGSFGEEVLLYYCVDEFSEFGGYDREAVRARESELLAKADLVITTSRALQDSKSKRNSNTHLVPHGVDHAHFRRALDEDMLPMDEMRLLPRPVLGFFGLIQDWIDVDLIAEVARARPAWSIVLIGDAVCDVSVLTTLRNVHLLGRRPYDDLPRFAKSFDVALIPFKINELTRHVNPIKLREYLSAGVPVVSTPLPEVQAYGQYVDVATSREFVAACERALASASAERQRVLSRAMAGESWDSKVETLSALVQSTVDRLFRAS